MGLISGRKAFQKPMKDGIELLNTIQDIYLDSSITIAVSYTHLDVYKRQRLFITGDKRIIEKQFS